LIEKRWRKRKKKAIERRTAILRSFTHKADGQHANATSLESGTGSIALDP